MRRAVGVVLGGWLLGAVAVWLLLPKFSPKIRLYVLPHWVEVVDQALEPILISGILQFPVFTLAALVVLWRKQKKTSAALMAATTAFFLVTIAWIGFVRMEGKPNLVILKSQPQFYR